MTYRVELTASAQKSYDALDPQFRRRILKALARLRDDPSGAPNTKPLVGGDYRLRVGDYRVLYAIHETVLLVLVVKVGHRREVYR